jgi:hypothetical protein
MERIVEKYYALCCVERTENFVKLLLERLHDCGVMG